MSPRLWRALAIALIALFFAGCIVHTRDRRPVHHRGHAVKHKKRRKGHRAHCAPSHYWDGSKCRHKGRGRGARKHDY